MPTFYETLGIPTDATAEEVRKAYKKKALSTHPDRLGPNVSAQDKADAEEKFREVSNAYEVLSNLENRQLYDKHGVWPPPQDTGRDNARHYSRRHDRPHYYPQAPTFTDAFEHFQRHFQSDFPNMHNGHFNDVNDVFRTMDAVFNTMNAAFNNSFAPAAQYGHYAPAPMRGAYNHRMVPGFDISFDPSHSRHVTTFTSSTRVGRESETYEETVINGVKRTVLKKVDRNGNVHRTETDSTGRKIYTINGVPRHQPVISDSHRPMPLPMDHQSRSTSHSSGTLAPRHKSSSRRHSPEYDPPPYQPDMYRDRTRDPNYHHHYHNTVYNSDDSDYDDYNYSRHAPHHHRHESGHRRRWWPFSH